MDAPSQEEKKNSPFFHFFLLFIAPNWLDDTSRIDESSYPYSVNWIKC